MEHHFTYLLTIGISSAQCECQKCLILVSEKGGFHFWNQFPLKE